MIGKYSLLCFSILMVTGYSTGKEITCYKCDSTDSWPYNHMCQYGMLPWLWSTQTCGSTSILSSIVEPSCYKIEALSRQGQYYTHRGCMEAGVSTMLCNGMVKALGLFSHMENDVRDMSCLTCDDNKCNSASKLNRGAVFIGLAFAALAFMF